MLNYTKSFPFPYFIFFVPGSQHQKSGDYFDFLIYFFPRLTFAQCFGLFKRLVSVSMLNLIFLLPIIPVPEGTGRHRAHVSWVAVTPLGSIPLHLPLSNLILNASFQSFHYFKSNTTALKIYLINPKNPENNSLLFKILGK